MIRRRKNAKKRRREEEKVLEIYICFVIASATADERYERRPGRDGPLRWLQTFAQRKPLGPRGPLLDTQHQFFQSNLYVGRGVDNDNGKH